MKLFFRFSCSSLVIHGYMDIHDQKQQTSITLVGDVGGQNPKVKPSGAEDNLEVLGNDHHPVESELFTIIA